MACGKRVRVPCNWWPTGCLVPAVLGIISPEEQPVLAGPLLSRARHEKSHISLGIGRGAWLSLERNRARLAIVEGLHQTVTIAAIRSVGSDRRARERSRTLPRRHRRAAW